MGVGCREREGEGGVWGEEDGEERRVRDREGVGNNAINVP